MAKHIEEPEAEAPEPSPSGDAGLAAAMAAALGRRKGTAKSDPKLDTFLDEQTRLVRLQTEHLHEQREVQLSHLKLRRFNEWMKAALQVMTACVGVMVVGAVAAMAWQAHADHGLVIQAFSVPPDLAQRGLNGQVVAGQVLDALKTMQDRTTSVRPASSYENNWGEDIKVEIPETGVSIGELNRYLRQWLGHETRIVGEVYRTPSGLAVTARAGASPGRTFQGQEAELDKLVGQAAEAVYADTQPYRYAIFLGSSGRAEEGLRALNELVLTGSAEEQGWVHIALAAGDYARGDGKAAISEARAAGALNPKLMQSRSFVAASEGMLGHREAALHEWERTNDMLRSGPVAEVPPKGVAGVLLLQETNIAALHGDYGARDQLTVRSTEAPLEGQARIALAIPAQIDALVARHDVTGAERMIASVQRLGVRAPAGAVDSARASEPLGLDDWPGAVRLLEPVVLPLKPGPGQPPSARFLFGATNLAWAYAMVGRRVEAEALLSTLPLDCDFCTIARGQVAAASRDWPAADRWFATAETQAPSIPFPDAAWGRALLAKGDLDGAIAKFAAANRKGPKFADPLEAWGEALMRKGDYAGAIAKFAEADRYAPHWGRNHMRWGEALMLSGRYHDARAQYEAANGMDLSIPDRAALNVLLARTASGTLHG
jgi:tetratricopeptide (TPR) repeat protein